jgi:pimeloyl-ACP methyl ester carboxylesterase
LEKNLQSRWKEGKFNVIAGAMEKKVVLVVHGWAGRATQFRRFIKPFLQVGFQVIGFDGPAHGQSEGRKTNPQEFRVVIEHLVNQLGNVTALLTHSFGGVTALYAVSTGVPVKTVVNIASPTISDEIVKTYLRAIGGSAKTGEAFKRYVFEKTGKPFSEFSALEFIKHVPADLNLLLIHDEDDKEVALIHPKELLKSFPQGELLQTKGLGHTRILKDENVIRSVVTFIQRHSSNS